MTDLDSPRLRHRLPSHRESDSDEEETISKWYEDETLDITTGQVTRSPRNYTTNQNKLIDETSRETNPQEQDYSKTKSSKLSYFIIFPILVPFLVFVFTRSMHSKIAVEPCKYKGLSQEDLRSHFANQPRDLTYIMKVILEQDRNSVDSLILLHSSDSYSTAKCFANKLAELYAHEKRNECNFTTIKPSDVNTADQDFGVVLEKYKNGSAVTVVQNLLGITPNKAQIFHTMCDDTQPMNLPSLIVFTLLSDNHPSNSPHHEARHILSSAWKDLPDNVLNPLLSRILGHVIKVSAEKELPCQKA